ncbi:MAG: hypothetical protein ACK2T7_03900, partial [Anaerolineales bacterium]
FGRGGLLSWFDENLPDPAEHRLYFDMGSKETGYPWVDRKLLKSHRIMDGFCRQAGYQDENSLLTIVAKGAKHHESAWRERVEGMIGFLLG